MRRKPSPEWIKRQQVNSSWVKAYVDAITNDRTVSLIKPVQTQRQHELFTD